MATRSSAACTRNGFLPQAGRIALYREPSAPGLRIDSGVEEGSEVGVSYDPLLSKLVAFAETRAAAAARARAALSQYPILGIRTNVPFLIRLLDHPAFLSGRLHTSFIDEHLAELIAEPEPPEEAIAIAALAGSRSAAAGDGAPRETPDPWRSLHGWGR